MSLWAVALLALTATAWGRELDAPKKVVNGTLMLENYFNAINFTDPFHTKYRSLLAKERNFLNRGGGTVFTLTDSERFSFTNPSLGYEGLSVFYSNQFAIYTLSMMISGTSYVEADFAAYSGDPTVAVKNFISKVQFSDVDFSCASEAESSAYASSHTTSLDSTVLYFHTGHFPWIKMQKPFTEGSTSMFCGFLTAVDIRTNIEWDLCNNQHHYVCERPALRNLPKAEPSSGYKQKEFLSHRNSVMSLLEKNSPHSSAKHSENLEAIARQYTNPDLIGAASQGQFFGGVGGLRGVTSALVAAGITYKPLDYQLYTESSGRILKFFLPEVTWDQAVAACVADGATLYAADHSVELDTIMAHFYPLLTPWVNVQKRHDSPSTDMDCGILRVGYVGPTLSWETCNRAFPYICEKIID